MAEDGETSQADPGQIAAQLLATRQKQYQDEDSKEGEDGPCGQNAVTKYGATHE